MSGIAGIVSFDGPAPDTLQLQEMATALALRGPDGQGVWRDAQAGLIHALLRTAEDDAAQAGPYTLDGQVWITADARVDGRAELVQRLPSSAGRGKAATLACSDAELILHSYAAWGQRCAEYLLGDFAFAIWDQARQILFCARDPFGLKPFYYAQLGRQFVFSNSLDCLRLHPQFSGQLNDLAIGDFLLFGLNQDLATTSWEQAKRLPPAHALVCSCDRLRVRRYWELPIEEPRPNKPSHDPVGHFRELLQLAVQDRLRGTHFGIFLSGGLDSCAIAATAAELLGRRNTDFELRAYTTVHDRLFDDAEGQYAAQAAQFLGMPIEFVRGHDYELFERFDQPELERPEPLDDPLAALEADQYRQIAKHSRVVFGGYGGDNLLHPEWRPYFGSCLRRGDISPAGRLVWHIAQTRSFPPPLAGVRRRFGRLLGRRNEAEFPGWLNPDFVQRFSLRERWQEVTAARNQASQNGHAFRPMAYRSLQSPLWPWLFENEDPGFTKTCVELRVPFFDLRLVRESLRIPPIPWCLDKKLLRAAMQGRLPQQILRRNKSPLAGDPVAALLGRQGLNGLSNFPAVPELRRYISPEHLAHLTKGATSGILDLHLRPICLNWWLKNNKLRRLPSVTYNFFEERGRCPRDK